MQPAPMRRQCCLLLEALFAVACSTKASWIYWHSSLTAPIQSRALGALLVMLSSGLQHMLNTDAVVAMLRAANTDTSSDASVQLERLVAAWIKRQRRRTELASDRLSNSCMIGHPSQEIVLPDLLGSVSGFRSFSPNPATINAATPQINSIRDAHRNSRR